MVSIFDTGPPPPCPAPFNMAAYVLGRAASLGDKPALEVLHADHTEIWKYAQLERAVLGTASGLLASGAKPGDRVLMRLGNTVEFPLTYLACIAVDLVPVPTAAQLTEPEVAKIIADVTPTLIARGDGIPCPETHVPQIAEAELEVMQSLPPADYAKGDPERLGYIIYTSGSSGVPRAVCHAHRAIWARRMMWDGWYGLTADDRVLHAGAFNWTYTLGTGLMDPWTVGATALIPAAGMPTEALPKLIGEHGATLFAAAPGVYRQVLHSADKLRTPTLRHGLSAGEKLSQSVADGWTRATGTPIFEAFGMSECSTFLSGSPTSPPPPGASGYPQLGRKVAILDDAGAPVPHDTPGVLAVDRHDPGLMLRYWGAEDETRARFVGDWFLTGDTCAMAADGAITYLGRADDMMNAGGFRVSPLEVEAILNAHPHVQESAVAEVAVKADTTVIAAFYVSNPSLDDADLTTFASQRLARYKQPRIYRRVAALPKGANGKLLRRELRQRYEDTHGQT
ncbi:class I adenylate-forming enzyme family protein [Aliiroseovarius sp. YM-037]|uniref:class I adenylate-forming enzyme family protein n=1 Tax=Aliiroseovarius sp. YM-037 TaxID=3341728 RepID=UPI003A7FF268